MWMPKGCCQLGRVDSSVSCKEASVDGQSESGKLIPMMVELDDPGGGKTPCVKTGSPDRKRMQTETRV